MSTTTNKTIHRATAVLSPPKPVSALITYSRSIVTRMTGNASFPAPAPTLAAISTATDELEAAEKAALARTKGAVATRNEKRAVLIGLLKQLRAYVQGIADADVTNGPAIIESAGMAVRRTAIRKPRIFAATPGPLSGVAKLRVASAGTRSSYEWAYSADGGKTWVEAPATMQAKTQIAGLVVGSTVQFRYRTVTARAGQGDWSQPVQLVIS
jgi:hypothetical protein